MIVKLYKDTLELDFDPVKHQYTLGGKKIDGVTSILKIINKPALIGWAVKTDLAHLRAALLESPNLTESSLNELIKEASNRHENIKTVSADFGTNVHQAIEYYIKGDAEALNQLTEKLNDEEIEAIKTFISWAEKSVGKFVDSERVVYSRKNRYCGTLDFTAFLKDGTGLYVGDIKTTGHIYPEYFLQTAAYEMAFREETGLNIEGRIIVRLKAGELETRITKDKTKDGAAFKAILKAYRRLNKLGAKV